MERRGTLRKSRRLAAKRRGKQEAARLSVGAVMGVTPRKHREHNLAAEGAVAAAVAAATRFTAHGKGQPPKARARWSKSPRDRASLTARSLALTRSIFDSPVPRRGAGRVATGHADEADPPEPRDSGEDHPLSDDGPAGEDRCRSPD